MVPCGLDVSALAIKLQYDFNCHSAITTSEPKIKTLLRSYNAFQLKFTLYQFRRQCCVLFCLETKISKCFQVTIRQMTNLKEIIFPIAQSTEEIFHVQEDVRRVGLSEQSLSLSFRSMQLQLVSKFKSPSVVRIEVQS